MKPFKFEIGESVNGVFAGRHFAGEITRRWQGDGNSYEVSSRGWPRGSVAFFWETELSGSVDHGQKTEGR